MEEGGGMRGGFENNRTNYEGEGWRELGDESPIALEVSRRTENTSSRQIEYRDDEFLHVTMKEWMGFKVGKVETWM